MVCPIFWWNRRVARQKHLRNDFGEALSTKQGAIGESVSSDEGRLCDLTGEPSIPEACKVSLRTSCRSVPQQKVRDKEKARQRKKHYRAIDVKSGQKRYFQEFSYGLELVRHITPKGVYIIKTKFCISPRRKPCISSLRKRIQPAADDILALSRYTRQGG